MIDKTSLIAELKKRSSVLGLQLRGDGDGPLTAEIESIRAKWWLGGRKVIYRASCGLSEPDRTVHFREAVVERSWGIPPPTLTMETTTTSGWTRSGQRTDVSLGGGGSVDYGKTRDAIERVVTAAGWTFKVEGGRMPHRL